MYNDVIKKTNYQIVNDLDITEIKNALEYAKGLIIKNQTLADSYETINSIRTSTLYISAVLGLNDVDELQRNIIIDTYEEINPYYLMLNEVYGIDIVEARTSKDFTILKATNNTLSNEDEILFKNCYNETLTFYSKVFFTKAFQNQTYNKEYFSLLLISMTIDKYFTRKLDNYYNIDLYNKKQLKNSFISYGFDYFDILPINYQRRMLKLLNEFIVSKGTNVDLRKILDIFGYKNIDIYKYILTKAYNLDSSGNKDYSNPFLMFYKTKVSEEIDYEKDVILSYDSITEKDPFWQASKEEVLKKQFNTITSKYMSVDLTLNALEQKALMSYFVSLLYKFKKEYSEKIDTSNFGFYNRDISSNKIDIFDGITGMVALICRSLKISETINKSPNKSLDIYGYNNISSNEDIQDILIDIRTLLIQNKYELNYDKQYEELYNFFQKFNLYDFNNPLNSNSLSSLYIEYNSNSTIQKQIEGIQRYNNNIALNDFIINKDNDIIDRMNFLRTYLIKGYIQSQTIMNFDELSSFFSKYLIIEGYRNPNTRVELNYIFLNNSTLAEETLKVVNMIGTKTILDYYNNNDYFAILEEAINYNTKRRSELMDKYNIKSDNDLKLIIYNDMKDISNYKEFYAFIELCYIPFRNISEDDKYNIVDFVDTFSNNEQLRNQLLSFLAEVNNYHLYRKILSLYNTKMYTKLDTSLYDSYDTFSDYIKNKDIEFYNWLTPTSDVEEDSEERKNFYSEKIIALAETIDTYIGKYDLFTNHTFTGIIDNIREILYLLITIFKSYTIDLVNTNTVLNIDDKTFNRIRLFDEMFVYKTTDKLYQRIALQDTYAEWLLESKQDKISLRDSYIIKEIEE